MADGWGWLDLLFKREQRDGSQALRQEGEERGRYGVGRGNVSERERLRTRCYASERKWV